MTALQEFLKHLTTQPGVYRMYNAQGTLLYVGKAKNLKKRVGSYFNRPPMEVKTQRLVSQVDHIEVTVTPTEVEALLLENTLIKQHKPRYNIIFKDDKSYPYLYLSPGDFPRLEAKRVKQKTAGEFFGPYPSLPAVRHTLELMYKTFQLRQCEDSVFKNRTRPCLQYQIKRCSAPCVGYISKDQYQEDLDKVRLFLKGKDQEVLKQLGEKMQYHSDQLNFEAAARIRDQIQALQQAQQQQIVHTEHEIDTDIITLSTQNNIYCVHILFIRHGRILGNKVFFPTVLETDTSENILQAFLLQFYTSEMATQSFPTEIILDRSLIIDPTLLAFFQAHGKLPEWKHDVRGIRKKWLDLAILNAQQALQSRLAREQQYHHQFVQLTKALNLAKTPLLMECFDISHTQGEATVASCVAFDIRGPLKSGYRRFNIEGITPGDDYAAIAQALKRHLTRWLKTEKALPELIFIDGGKGQLSAAQNVLNELRVTGMNLVGVAKGPSRKAGLELLWRTDHELPLSLPENDPALHLIQQIRDEAHRFAITGHRKQRQKKRVQSVLENIPGVGEKRRQALLQHFGGWQGLKSATLDELTKIPGIHKRLATEIVEWLRR